MKILILGASGMVGRGVLRECLAAADVEWVHALGRSQPDIVDPRLSNHSCLDLFQIPPQIWADLAGSDACFFCLGVSSSGMDEAAYTRLTLELTLAIAAPLAQANPAMTFVYVSGAGTKAAGRAMWARVKGRTEQALAALPFAGVFSLRPGVILPINGERSGVSSYRVFYRVAGPLLRAIRRFFPGRLLTTETIGQVMLVLARRKSGRGILEASDIAQTVRSAHDVPGSIDGTT